MTLHYDFPALKSCTYLNTAYVGLMSQSLFDYRTAYEKNHLLNADLYKIDAYDRLDQTHATISSFIGSKKEQTYFVSNFLWKSKSCEVFQKHNEKFTITSFLLNPLQNLRLRGVYLELRV